MKSSYLLKCSVCKREYFTKCEWLQHLSSYIHQLFARRECLKSWGNSQEIKDCCLFVFSSFPLINQDGDISGANKVIQQLSNSSGIFVTDFVCWEERPCIALVQFESREKLAKHLPEPCDTKDMMVDGERIQVKRAVNCNDLQWNAILPTIATEQVTRTESPVECEQSKANNEPSKKINHGDSVGPLFKLANKQGWSIKFIWEECGKAAFLCTVEMTRKHDLNLKKKLFAAGESREEAKQNAASRCLKILQSFTSNPDENSRGSNLRSEPILKQIPRSNLKKIKAGQNKKAGKLNAANQFLNAKTDLNTFSYHQGWNVPEYKFFKDGRGKIALWHSCVTVNGVEYKQSKTRRDWDATVPRSSKKQRLRPRAESYTAAGCLEMLRIWDPITNKNSSAIV